MIDFYNAFISYKHGPLDSKIAAHIQRKLEHFHVPHKLGKKLKHKKITQIFRDKDELPITSDLTETITNALEKAEYLIVICSTHTKESFWVKREINTFLQTHTQDKVLTVLTEGEPIDVIPEELLSQVKEYTDENGFLQRVKVPVEPLSCDYRMRTSQADKEELPRLAAAVLGCSYDELLRRRRQYRIRRAAAIVGVAFAAIMAFCFYMGYMTKKINDSYIDSLRSRSKYLATESEQLLAEGKRADAIQLALAALPDGEDSKMPVTGPAIRAITDATGSYKSNAGASYIPVWNYTTDHPISIGIMSEDEIYIAAMDKSGSTYCWDTRSRELVFKKIGENDPLDIVFMGNESILITYRYRMEAYNIKTGTLIWSYDMDKDASLYKGEVICVEHSVYFDNGDGKILKLSAKDGSVKDTYEVKKDDLLKTFESLTVSSDGKKLAYVDSTFNFGDSKIYLYDTETHKEISANYGGFLIEDISFADSDHLFIVTTDDLTKSSTAFSDDLTYIQTGKMMVSCYDSSLKPAWAEELEYTDVASGIGTMYLSSRDAVLYYVGNSAAVYDIKTGEATNNYNTGSSIVSVEDFNNNGLPEFICRHGEYIFTLNETTDDMAAYNVLCNDIIIGMVGEYIYAVSDYGTDIICYSRYLQDSEWTPVNTYAGYSTGTTYQRSYAEDNTLIIASKIEDVDKIRISFIDLEEGKLASSTEVDCKGYLSQLFDIERVGDNIYGYFGDLVYIIDPENETVTKTKIELYDRETISNGKIIGYDIKYSELTVEVTDIDGKNNKSYKLEDLENFNSFELEDPVYNEKLNKVFVPVGSTLYAADLSSSKIKEVNVPETWFVNESFDFYITTSDDGSQILISDGDTIFVTDDSFKEQYSIRCNCSYRLSATFRNGTLYIVDDEYLLLYDAKTGEFKGKYEMTLFGIGYSELQFDDKNHQLFIQVGDQISVFDTESWVETICVENAYCYHEGSDRFYVYSYQVSTDCTPGYIKHYTLDELIEKAKTLLNGQELSDAVKSKYGL
ncbi:MAG: TIR domain-containing protein [Clostridiales bacterium]|nr:TIR domain-containing protein [Clostridiales bacterium]